MRNSSITNKLSTAKLLIMDFDGVHTDGYVYLDQNGKETVRCSRRDGLGLAMLKKAQMRLVVISKEKNPVVLARCKKLDIECYQGVDDSAGKLHILSSLIERENISREHVAFIGDDVNDIDALKHAGISVTVADGHEAVKKIVDLVLTRKGGEHALRELCERILKAKKISTLH